MRQEEELDRLDDGFLSVQKNLFQKSALKKSYGYLTLVTPPGQLWWRSGREMAFCPCNPGSNPVTDLAFFGSESPFIYSHWASGFLKERVIEWCILLPLLLSNFLLSFTTEKISIVLYQ